MNPHHGSSLDSLLDELGEREEVEALASKKVLAIQAGWRMRELGLSTTQLAARMHTSRNQVLRAHAYALHVEDFQPPNGQKVQSQPFLDNNNFGNSPVSSKSSASVTARRTLR